jgi:hypothetical protein
MATIQSAYSAINKGKIVGYAPLTVHVNAQNASGSNFYEWNFGDTGRTNSSSQDDLTFDADNDLFKTTDREPVMPYGSKDLGSTTTPFRDVDLNSDQRGAAAAYTYQRPGTYSLTLTEYTAPDASPVVTTVTVEISDANPGSYPVANGTTNWTKIDITSDDEAAGTDFATAISNANARGGQTVIQFGSGTNYVKISSQITIDCSDLVIRGTGTKRPIFCSTLDDGSPRDNFDLLTVSNTSQNIYIEGVRFRPYDDEGQSGSLNMNNYNPSSHTSIRALVSSGDAGSNARAITLETCDIWNFTTAIDITGGTGFYAHRLASNRHNEAHVKLNMSNVVITGMTCGTNVQTSPTQTIQNDFTSIPAYVIELGNTDRINSYFNISCCRMFYGGSANYETFTDAYPAASTYNVDSDSGSFSGPIKLTRMARGNIYRNSLERGTNSLDYDCFNVVISRNYFETGGMSAALELNTGASAIYCYSNVFELREGRAQSYAIAKRDSGGTEFQDVIRIDNNTFILSKDISKNGGSIYLQSNGTPAAQDCFSINNNLFVDHHSYQAKVFSVQSGVTEFSNNVYFDSRPQVDFGRFGSTDYTYDEWKLNVEPSASIERVEHRFMKNYWMFTPDPSKHSVLSSGGSSFSVYEDIVGNRYSGSVGIGAAKIDASNYAIGNTQPFTFDLVISDRTDRLASGDLDINGDPISDNPGDNAVLTISDPENGDYVLHRDFQRPLLQFTGQPWDAVGEWIRTDISNIETTDDSIAFDLTYTNDGPASQLLPIRDGFNSNYDGLTELQKAEFADHEFYFNYDERDMPKMALGSLGTLYANLGDKFAVLQQYRGSGFSDVKARSTNIFNLSNRTYPGDKYSSTFLCLNHEYAIGVSLMWDIENTDQSFTSFDNCGATSSSKGTLSYVTSWRRLFNIRNPISETSSTGTSAYWLESGESFTIRLAYKVTRNSRYNHVQTLSPYKEFFNQTYAPGEVVYTLDPRPIQGILPPQSAALSFPGNVYGYALGSLRPDTKGWQPYRDYITAYETDLGIERSLMWAPAGNLLINRAGNYPFLMWTPFYDAGERTVGEFFPSKPLPSGVDPEDIVTDSDYPNGTFDPYPVQAMFDELPLMQNLNFEYPSMGYYWGRATQIQRGWDTGDIEYYSANVPDTRARFMREFDFMAQRFRSRLVAMDAYRTSRFGYLEQSSEPGARRSYGGPAFEEIELMRAMIQRWPHCKIGTELALPDVFHRLGGVFYFNSTQILTQSHFMADYLNPGHESWSGFRYDQRTRNWGGRFDQTNDQRRYMMKGMAELGWVALNFSNVELNTGGYVPEDFLARDRRFDFIEKPSDGKIPEQPGRFAYIISEGRPLFDANYVRLRWDPNQENDIRFYKIQKARMVNGEPDINDFMTIDYTTKTRFVDIASRDNDNYVYRVIAVDHDGNESIPSEFAVQRVPDDPILRPPIPIRATPQLENGSIRLDWVDQP